DEQTKDFEAAYAKASNYLQQSPHCLSYKVVHNIEHPNRFVVLIHWDSIEGHTNGFSRSDLLKPFLAILHDYLPYIVEMNHYEETPVKWKRAKN
ncbi:MAG: antibiotic biosynthesis monooxygenase, partial [Cytophagales bacterium]|nr:antibiotic biosynthesis monooxygenase [Cytophagales bacterium]